MSNTAYITDDELPKGWVKVELKEIADQIHYGFTTTSAGRDTGIRILRITDIQNGKVAWDDAPFVEIDHSNLEKYRLYIGDIVFARSGNTVGKTFMIEETIPTAVFASYLIRIKLPSTFVSQKYVFHFFQSTDYWKQIREGQAGIGQPNFNGTKLSELNLPLPPLPEQHRISSKLDRLFARLARAEAALVAAETALERYRQSVLNTVFKAEDENLKEGWKWVKLGEVLTLKNGYAFKSSDYAESGIPLIRISDINEGFVSTENSVFIPENKAMKGFFVQTGDILIAMSGATTGKFGIYKEDTPALQNQRVGSFKVTKPELLDSEFLYHLVETFKKEIEERAYGGAQPNISSKMIEEIKVALPSIGVQKLIIAKIVQYLSNKTTLQSAVQSARVECVRLRQSILQEAFSGHLVPQVVGDEPASELINRKKAAQETKEKNGKQRGRSSSKTIERKKMEKLKEGKPILDILRESEGAPVKAQTVWLKSEFKDSIDKFYEALKVLIEVDKTVKETREGDITYLTLSHEN